MASDQPVVCSRMDADVELESLDNFLRFCRHMLRPTLHNKYLGCEQFLSGGAYDVPVKWSAPCVRDDVDVMVIAPDCCAISADTSFVAPREIQLAFGFLTLFMKLEHKEVDVVIIMCPVICAYYFKMRCLQPTENYVDAYSVARILNELSAHRCNLD